MLSIIGTERLAIQATLLEIPPGAGVLLYPGADGRSGCNKKYSINVGSAWCRVLLCMCKIYDRTARQDVASLQDSGGKVVKPFLLKWHTENK